MRRFVLPAMLLLASVARAEEGSIIPDSTVIGVNYGYPSGTPSQGETPVRELALVLEIAAYLKNAEVSGLPTVDGETFIGFQVPLRARYRAHEDLTVEVGAVLGHDFGDADPVNIAELLVRLGYEPAPDVFLLAGTILPTHWIHEALLDDVQKLRVGAEQGFQLRVDRGRFKEDLWINWRVREDEFTAEEFEVGNATRGRLFAERLWLDFHFLIAHVGGQQNTTGRIETNATLLGGLSWGFPHPFGWTAVDEVRVGGRAFFSFDEVRGQPDLEGSGYEAFLSVDVHPAPATLIRVYAAYFAGDDFLARRGDPLYSLDDYAQLGVDAVFRVAGDDLRIEVGAVAQHVDGELNYSFKITFVWGHAFRLAKTPEEASVGLAPP
jgi:hypothetical protein